MDGQKEAKKEMEKGRADGERTCRWRKDVQMEKGEKDENY